MLLVRLPASPKLEDRDFNPVGASVTTVLTLLAFKFNDCTDLMHRLFASF